MCVYAHFLVEAVGRCLLEACPVSGCPVGWQSRGGSVSGQLKVERLRHKFPLAESIEMWPCLLFVLGARQPPTTTFLLSRRAISESALSLAWAGLAGAGGFPKNLCPAGPSSFLLPISHQCVALQIAAFRGRAGSCRHQGAG